MLVSVVLALVGGLLVVGAFEPVGLVVLGPLGVGLVVVALHRLSGRRGRGVLLALVPGMTFGAAFMLPLLVWMRVIGPDAWVGVALLEAAFYAVWAVVAVVLMRLPGWPVWVSLAWLATETARSSWPFGGFPWGRLAFGTVDTAYAAGLPWWGTSGVSLLVAGTGVGLAWLVVEGRRRRARAAAAATGLVAVVALPVAVGATAAGPEQPTGDDTVRIAAVQGDVPGPGDDVLHDSAGLTRNHVEATQDLAARVEAGRTPQPDLVVWPENSTTVDPFATGGAGPSAEPVTPLRREVNAGILAAVAAIDTPVLVGAIVDAPTPGQVLNQGIVWTPDAGPTERYAKRHPVPFGEFIPFRGSTLLGGLVEQVERLDLVPRDMLAGTRTSPMDVDGLAVADAICFDVAYDDGILAQVREGAEVLVVQTSNAMFVDTAQIDQQFEISRLRAIETGRTTVVAAINGVSGVIGPDGEVRSSAGPRTAAVLEADVVRATGTPPSVWVGPWLGRVASAATLVGLLVGVVGARRRRSVGSSADHREKEQQK